MEGLENISVFSLLLDSNVQLNTLDGIHKKDVQGGLISIQNSPLLNSLEPLSNVLGAGTIDLVNIDVVDLSGLRNIQTAIDIQLRELPRLSNIEALSGMSGLETLTVVNNPSLLFT